MYIDVMPAGMLAPATLPTFHVKPARVLMVIDVMPAGMLAPATLPTFHVKFGRVLMYIDVMPAGTGAALLTVHDVLVSRMSIFQISAAFVTVTVYVLAAA